MEDVERIELGASPVFVCRAFSWGVVIVGDPAAAMPTREGRDTFVANRSSMAIGVRHAADWDGDSSDPFEVVLLLSIGSRHQDPTREAVLDLSGGELAVGDADHEDLFRIAPGRWRVSILAKPEDHPESLDVRLVRSPIQQRSR